jgi:hypothetical protein
MSRRTRAGALLALNAVLLAGAASAADDPAVLKDLTAVIALQGQPCGQVVSVTRQGENDYIASCQDGNRYRVFVSSQGRVVVQKQ